MCECKDKEPRSLIIPGDQGTDCGCSEEPRSLIIPGDQDSRLLFNRRDLLTRAGKGAAGLVSVAGILSGVGISAHGTQRQGSDLLPEQRRFVGEIQKRAKDTLAKYPDPSKIRGLNDMGKVYMTQVRRILEEASNPANLQSRARVESLYKDLAWLRFVSKMNANYMAKAIAPDAPERPRSCMVVCSKQYDDCINGFGCDEDAWFCGCCFLCALEMEGCAIKCIGIPGLGGGSSLWNVRW